MFWEFRKKIYGQFLIKLFRFMLIMCLLLVLILGDTFVNRMIVEATTYSNKIVDIKPGEDLSKYEYKKVRCTIKYVINRVINFYDRDDPNKEVYTCGFVALDDNMENPFCVFVDPSNRSQMEILLEKTWEMKQGKSKVDFAETITIEGYVYETNDKVFDPNNKVYEEYTTALRWIYGEDYKIDEPSVFYIYDGSDIQDEDEQSGETGFAFMLLIVAIMFITIAYIIVRCLQILFWKKNIHEFMRQNRISKTQLQEEFKNAEKVISNYWISPQYTFYIRDLEVVVLKNQDIVWCYPINWFGNRNVTSIGLGTIQGAKYRSDVKMRKSTEKVLQYYANNFSHLVIGSNK